MISLYFCWMSFEREANPFRSLKFNFVNVGLSNGPNNSSNPTSPLTPASGNSSAAAPASASLNTTAAPVLASVFTKPFQVFSAKKFPGVIESTELSKTFAQQGIKIPIRKDGESGGSKKRRNLEEDEEFGDDE
jgi:Velvet factor